MATFTKQSQIYTTIGLGVGTVFLATLQTLCFVGVIRDAAIALQTQASVFLPTSIFLLIPYILISTIGCGIISLLFRPKRILSSINVQVLAVSIVTLMVIYSVSVTDLGPPLVMTSPASAIQTYQNLIVTIVFSYLFAMAFGLSEVRFVRWFVGLNEESTDKQAYLIDKNPEEVMELLGKYLSESLHFKISKVGKKCWLLKRVDEWNNSILMAIGPDPIDHNNYSVLATVTFSVGRFTIRATKQASDMRDSIINDMQTRLSKSGSDLEPVGEIENEISEIAYDARKTFTSSKIEVTQEVFRQIPKPYRAILYVVIGAFILVTIAFALHIGNFDFNTYLVLSSAFILAIVVDIGIPLSENVYRRRKRKRF